MTDLTGAAPVSLDGEDYYQDPWGFFARLRESRPVTPVHKPGYGRGWVITRYADVRAALADPRLARDLSRWPGGPRARPAEDRGVSSHMLHADPPGHTRLRRPVQQAFTARRIERLRPRAAQAAAALASELAPAGGDVTDLLAGYARPLPVTVLCELLGVPGADRAQVAATVLRYDEPGEMAAVESELAAYFTGLIAARRAGPGDDLLSALAAAADEGEAGGRLTGPELVSTAYLLVMAGFDTTVNLIASGVLALATHPGELARLRASRALLPGAVEELLRYTSPVNHANDRFTTEAVTIGGVTIPAGEWVFAALPPASRDPARFPRPDQLDLRRDTSGHLAFGHGIHYCLGAPLARMEAEVALAALLDRFPRWSLAVPPAELRWRPVSLMNGLESLPVRLN